MGSDTYHLVSRISEASTLSTDSQDFWPINLKFLMFGFGRSLSLWTVNWLSELVKKPSSIVVACFIIHKSKSCQNMCIFTPSSWLPLYSLQNSYKCSIKSLNNLKLPSLPWVPGLEHINFHDFGCSTNRFLLLNSRHTQKNTNMPPLPKQNFISQPMVLQSERWVFKGV